MAPRRASLITAPRWSEASALDRAQISEAQKTGADLYPGQQLCPPLRPPRARNLASTPNLEEPLSVPNLDTLATIFFGTTTLVLGVLSYQLQKRAHQAESKLKDLEYQATAIQLDRSQRAVLEPYLQPDPGPRSFVLVVRNIGASTAYDVVVLAHHDSGKFRHFVTFPTIGPGAQQTFVFTNHDWQVIGASKLSLQLHWDDASGHHDEPSMATMRR